MTAWEAIQFLVCVAVATCAQSLTGFAFAIILTGLAGALRLVPLADAVNVATVLSLANALVALRGARKSVDWLALRDVAAGSFVGIGVGVLLLGWLSTNTVQLLRMLLGVTILGCAASVFFQGHPLPGRSARGVFAAFGTAAGVFGGLFNASGPVLVYHFYRQPLALQTIRETLIAILAVSSLLRLAMVVPAGQFSLRALALCALGAPLVALVTWLFKRFPPGWPRERVLKAVCVLLVATGLSLIWPA